MAFTYDKQKLVKIAKRFHLKFIVLHGSYATGQQRRDSDLDIAVLGKRQIDFDTQLKLHIKLAEIFGDSPRRELDLKTLHRVDPLFRHEVVSDGVLLYGDPTAYEEFKSFTERAYRDARSLFELERTLSRKYQKHLMQLAAAYA